MCFMETPRLIRKVLYVVFGFFLFWFCPLFFCVDLTRNPYYTQIALLNILVPGCCLLWLWQALESQEIVWVTTALDTVLLAFVGVCLFSWVWSMILHPTFLKPIYSEGSKAAVFLLVNTYLVYAGALQIRDRSVGRYLLWLCYAVSFLASLYGVMQYFGIEIVWPSHLNPYGYRPVSTFGNPNFMSSYLVVVLPVMVADYLNKVTGCPRSILFICIQMSLCGAARDSYAILLGGTCRRIFNSFLGNPFRQRHTGQSQMDFGNHDAPSCVCVAEWGVGTGISHDRD